MADGGHKETKKKPKESSKQARENLNISFTAEYFMMMSNFGFTFA